MCLCVLFVCDMFIILCTIVYTEWDYNKILPYPTYLFLQSYIWIIYEKTANDIALKFPISMEQYIIYPLQFELC